MWIFQRNNQTFELKIEIHILVDPGNVQQLWVRNKLRLIQKYELFMSDI